MNDANQSEPLKLSDELRHMFEECRMVLPGIQALFGFQMIAVFSDGFSSRLALREQHAHGVAIGFVVLAIAFIMSPAALHRRAEPKVVTVRFLRVASRMLFAAMICLAVGLSLDVFVVTTMISPRPALALGAALSTVALFLVLWEGYPALYRKSA